MTAQDGQVRKRFRIVDNGPDSDRYNIVFLGDGYREAQLPKYRQDVKAIADGLKATAPFDKLWSGINVHRIEVTSTDAGADDPVACGGSGATARTFFDASFCNSGVRRLLVIDTARAMSVARAKVPQAHFVLCLVNSTIYGGAGGAVATTSMAPGAIHIAVHEMGHSAFGLADEYEYYRGCGSGETDRNRHPPVEPFEPNVTTRTVAATMKWAAQLTKAADGLPTTANANCAQCDPQASPRPAGYVGAFEGAHYHHCGAFRPAFNCKMRTISAGFCAVCQQVIRQTLAPFQPP